MRVTTQGIILHNVKYADAKVISKIYTKDYGLLNLHINISNKSKTGIRMALIQPLSQVELVFLLKENREVHQVTEIKPVYIYSNLSNNIIKLCIAQFINEVLYKCIKEESKNEELYEFISQIFQWLDLNHTGYYDLHLYVLFELTKYLGFYPTNNISSQDKYFDIREGRYESYSQSFPLSMDEKQSVLFARLFTYNLTSEKLFTKQERLSILECLIAYYKMHIPGLHEFKSFGVLQETINS